MVEKITFGNAPIKNWKLPYSHAHLPKYLYKLQKKGEHHRFRQKIFNLRLGLMRQNQFFCRSPVSLISVMLPLLGKINLQIVDNERID